MTRSLPPRSLLVTGAVGGLGAVIAATALDDGDRVAAVDRPGSGAPFEADVTDEAAVEAVLDRFGTPDVVVNCAGIVRFGALVDQPVTWWREVLEVNLTGALVVARAAARRWITAGRGGVVVNVTSMNGVAAGPGSGAYAAAKAGLVMLTQQMALEWGPHGIRVNAVAPGLIDAGMSAPIYADAATRAAREAKVPLGRLGTAADVARVVRFLASDDAAYVHGQNLLVDGGVTGSVIAGLPRPRTVEPTPSPASERRHPEG